MSKHFLFLSFIILLFGCKSAKVADKNYQSDSIVIQKLSDHVYQHISFLQTESFGKVPCNGMVVFDQGEAIVFDTPADDSTSEELIGWIRDSLNCKIKAVIATHFHGDCLGGLSAFHKHGISSYAHNPTIKSVELNKYVLPQNGFDNLLELKVGKREVVTEFFGEGHTRDNVIGYFPSEKAMFGGCLIKEIDATKGYLGDANVKDWPATVAKLKAKYPEAKLVIPGHGETGGMELLDYTIKLFTEK